MSFDDEVAKFNSKLTVAKAWYVSHQFYAGVIAGAVVGVLLVKLVF